MTKLLELKRNLKYVIKTFLIRVYRYIKLLLLLKIVKINNSKKKKKKKGQMHYEKIAFFQI